VKYELWSSVTEISFGLSRVGPLLCDCPCSLCQSEIDERGLVTVVFLYLSPFLLVSEHGSVFGNLGTTC
jgi:hypothetical protein